MTSFGEYEQRVVYAGLKRMSQDRNTIKAGYQRWKAQATSDADGEFDVFAIVADLTGFLGLDDAERKTLMVALHAASGRLVEELDPVPEYVSSDAAQNLNQVKDSPSAAKVTRRIAAHKAVTERYLQLVCQHVKRHSSESFRELVMIISDEGIPRVTSGLNQVIKSWGASGLDKLNFADDVSSDECENVALEFYVLLTEIVGPVESDVIVNKSISEVLTMDAAQSFNPRNLL